MFVSFWHRMLLLLFCCFCWASSNRKCWCGWCACVRARMSILNINREFVCTSKVWAEKSRKGKLREYCDRNDSGDGGGGGGGASGTFDWDPFIWRYLWCFHLEIIRSTAHVLFFIVLSCTRILTAAPAFNRQHLGNIDNFQRLIFFFFFVIIFHFAKFHRAFNFTARTLVTQTMHCCARNETKKK